MGYLGKGDTVPPCMDVYNAQIKYGVIIDKLKV